jgi:hypothetical protein
VKHRISTGGGLLFKGSGFYTTDYRSEGYQQAAKKDAATSNVPGDKSKPGKSETKAVPAKTPDKAAGK